MQRRLLALLGLLFLSALTMVGVPPSRAAAGGWAVTTLDPVPALRVGEMVPIGFVIRQHGVTPVQLDTDVGIEVRSASGRVEHFAAAPSGAVGHYVAPVTFREAGQVSWSVHQGWFGPQDLGVVDVATAGGDTATAAADHDWPAVVRFGVPVLALIAGAFMVGDLVRSRRHRVAT